MDYVVVDRRVGDNTWDRAEVPSAQETDALGSEILTLLFDNVDFTVYGVRVSDEPTG